MPRQLVAVGKLDRVWLSPPEEVSEKDLQDAFRSYFGAEWAAVLDVADKSFAYNAANNVYFAVRELRPLENLTLAQLLEKQDIGRAINIIVS